MKFSWNVLIAVILKLVSKLYENGKLKYAFGNMSEKKTPHAVTYTKQPQKNTTTLRKYIFVLIWKIYIFTLFQATLYKRAIQFLYLIFNRSRRITRYII